MGTGKMIELWKSLTDDQVAVVSCVAALFSTGTLMCLSHFIGRRRTRFVSSTDGEITKGSAARGGEGRIGVASLEQKSTRRNAA
jgi:hypothetical protein